MAGSNTPRDSKRTIELLETTPETLRSAIIKRGGSGRRGGHGGLVSVLVPHSLDEGRRGGGRVGPVGDDALAAAGEEEGVAHLAEGLPVVGVDRRLRAAAPPAAGEGGERRREHREAAEIHGGAEGRRGRAGDLAGAAQCREEPRGGAVGGGRSVTRLALGRAPVGPTGRWQRRLLIKDGTPDTRELQRDGGSENVGTSHCLWARPNSCRLASFSGI